MLGPSWVSPTQVTDMTSESLGTLDRLCSANSGGIITLSIEAQFAPNAKAHYCEAIARLDEFAFWHRGEGAAYRP
jgi:hypothetical protein